MTQIIRTLTDDALAVFSGQTIDGDALEAHTGFRYLAERGRRQTFRSYTTMLDAMKTAGVVEELRDGQLFYTFP